MKSYYSIVYANVNTFANERISIGLILISGKSVFFRYSEDKLNHIKSLYQSDGFNLLKTSLKSANHFFCASKAEQVWEGTLFPEGFSEIMHSEKYISYLSEYCSNAITFSPPITIDYHDDQILFEALYNNLIFNDENLLQNKIDKITAVKNLLYPKILKRVNIEKQLDHSNLPQLICPVNVSFIGKNEIPVVGKVVDFEKRVDILENALGEYHILMKAFDKNKTPGCYYIIGDEPGKEKKLNHEIWHNLHQIDYISLVSVDEIQSIEEYLNSHEVQPYFSDIDETETN